MAQIFKIEQWMNRNPYTITKDKPAGEAASIMAQHRVGCVIVVENEVPIGIVSETDIVRKLTAKRKNADQTPVEDIMSSPVICAEVGMQINEVSNIMINRRIRKIPIVDGGKLRGIITATDIVRIMADFNKLYEAKDIIELGF
jgi:CBS domain-containing protein